MIIVHYEVYVLEGRGWMLHARFPRTERETAINEAKELEQTLNVRVKVLRETYYTDNNAFEEAEVYVSGMKLPDKRPPPPPKPSAPPRSAAAPSPPQRSGTSSKGAAKPAARPTVPPPLRAAPPRAQKSAEDMERARMLLARLFAIVAVALAVALLSIKFTPDGIMLLWKMGFVITVTPESYGQMLFGVFVSSFLMVALPLAVRYLPRKINTAGPRWMEMGSAAADATPASSDPERDKAVKKSLDKLAAKALAEQEAPPAPKTDDPPEDELDDLDLEDLPEIRPDPEDLIAEMQAKEKKERERREQEERDKRPQDEQLAAKEEKSDEKKDEKRDAKTEEKKPGVPNVETLQPTVSRFVNGAVTAAKGITPNMDAFTKFALHLYLAGAVESLCDFKKQAESAKLKLVILALEGLGTRGDLASKFYEKIEEYLLEPRYLGVVQAGRNAMGDFMLGDEAGAHAALRDVFAEWNRKSDKKAQIVTVMFTDMVGSTDLTQARGDAAAQEVVRRHNAIVRGALAQFLGKEIKHTGDGIMASFSSAAAAVEASVSIQRQVAQLNQRMPNLGLHLRIGLNAGEPIEEEDDLFGATVQLAARVCAATNTDQTLCTGVVKDLSANKGATTFKPLGEKPLKGFKEAVPLFEVVWK